MWLCCKLMKDKQTAPGKSNGTERMVMNRWICSELNNIHFNEKHLKGALVELKLNPSSNLSSIMTYKQHNNPAEDHPFAT